MTPAVSVVVPTHNYARFLGTCLSSILGQTFTDVEVLVIDDASSDDTASVVEGFKDPRLTYWRNSRNLGHVHTFNRGITLSRGRHVCLLSADDYMLSSRNLERKVEVLEANPQVSIVLGSGVEVTERGSVVGSVNRRHLPAIHDENILERMLEWLLEWMEPPYASGAELIRRRCYQEVGLFDPSLSAFEDWELLLRMTARYRATFLPGDLVAKRVHPEGQSGRNIDSGRAYRDLKEFMVTTFDRYPEQTARYSLPKLYGRNRLRILAERVRRWPELGAMLREYRDNLRVHWPNVMDPINFRVLTSIAVSQAGRLCGRLPKDAAGGSVAAQDPVPEADTWGGSNLLAPPLPSSGPSR